MIFYLKLFEIISFSEASKAYSSSCDLQGNVLKNEELLFCFALHVQKAFFSSNSTKK